MATPVRRPVPYYKPYPLLSVHISIFVNATMISSAKLRSFPRIRKQQQQNKKEKVETWSNTKLEQIWRNTYWIRIKNPDCFSTFKKSQSRKILRIFKNAFIHMTFYLNTQMLRKITEPSTTTVPILGWYWQWSLAVWNACWDLLSVLAVLWGPWEGDGKMHRL